MNWEAIGAIAELLGAVGVIVYVVEPTWTMDGFR